MPQCKHYEICGLDANPGEDLCILHSQHPDKDRSAFDEFLAAHREKNGHNFQHFVFPYHVDFFKKTTFTEWARFFYATFTHGADFSRARFMKGADFSHATLTGYAKFVSTTFTKNTKFSDATFTGWADFRQAAFDNQTSFARATFSEEGVCFNDAEFRARAIFSNAKFVAEASFAGAIFNTGGEFYGATFSEPAEFFRARFLGRTLFVSKKEEGRTIPIFAETEVSFRQVDIAPLDALIFRDADLQKCQFLGTDLRKAEFTNVKWPETICKKWPKFIRARWPQMVSRFAVYDEIEVEQKGEAENRSHVEQLYRQLKQNYEDRRDYERARHFHIGEKETRRKNSRGGLRILLTAYRWVSGYGESCLLPLIWVVILLAGTTAAYLYWNLLGSNPHITPVPDSASIKEVGLYSLRVMTLLKPSDFVPSGFGGNFVNWIQSIFGPLLFGLFALALRQRLKR
jgi:uncharacterized protein YjbI with pentapeptide repeats